MESTALTPVEEAIKTLYQKRSERIRALIHPQSKQPYFYLSSVHTCARNLCYRLTHGDQRPEFDEYVQAKLEAGNEQERIVKGELLAMGYELIKAQERLEVPYQGPVEKLRGQVIAVGKIDGALRFGGVEIPTEIKACHPNVWTRLNSVDDLLKYEHAERYVRQLLLYVYAKNLEYGMFILVDFLGHWKFIPIMLGNYLEVAELALRTMEIAWAATAEKKEPDRISYHHKICGRCDFASICLPDVKVDGTAQVIDDPEIEATITRHEELKKISKEYDDLHDSLVAQFQNFPVSTVGRWIIEAKKRKRTSYDAKQLSDEDRAKIKVETEFVVINIKDLDKVKEKKV